MMFNEIDKTDIIYASPWVPISAHHFLRYIINVGTTNPNSPNNKHDVARVFGKTKKGVAAWTWTVMPFGRYVSTLTGTCQNKRDALRACDEALKTARVFLLKPKHYSFL